MEGDKDHGNSRENITHHIGNPEFRTTADQRNKPKMTKSSVYLSDAVKCEMAGNLRSSTSLDLDCSESLLIHKQAPSLICIHPIKAKKPEQVQLYELHKLA